MSDESDDFSPEERDFRRRRATIALGFTEAPKELVEEARNSLIAEAMPPADNPFLGMLGMSVPRKPTFVEMSPLERLKRDLLKKHRGWR